MTSNLLARRKKLFIGISAPNSVDLLVGQLRFFKEHSYEVRLLAPPDVRVTEFCKQEGVTQLSVDMERSIAPIKDLCSLAALIKLFVRERPDIINMGTPKMGLLGMVAGYLTGVPCRIYTCRGFRFQHESGWSKYLLIFLERITARCAHRVFCISRSVKELGVCMNLFPEYKSRLIAYGSSNGVDLCMFDPDKVSKAELDRLVSKYELKNCLVYGFVGRLIDRKGLKEMYDAFSEIFESNMQARLLVVGRPFWDQIRDPSIIDRYNKHPGIIMVGFQPMERIPCFLAAMNVFVLASRWEGFGNVLIQAAAMGVPVVATDVTGIKDAVSPGYNGVLVPHGDHHGLVGAMRILAENESFRRTLGHNGKRWSQNFQPEIIWRGYLSLFEEAV